MNSFQAQFNSLLGIALGAKEFGAKKALGTPSAPTPSVGSQPKKMVEGSSKDQYKAYETDFGHNFLTSTASLTPEAQKAYEAKQRSLENLKNRHNALRMLKAQRQAEKIKSVAATRPTDTPLGSIKSHKLGGNF
jgi:hypothetical protein